MSDLSPILFTPRLEKVLSEIVRREGNVLFRQLLQERARQPAPTRRPTLTQVLRQTAGRVQREIRKQGVVPLSRKGVELAVTQGRDFLRGLPGPRESLRRVASGEAIEQGVLGALQATGFLGGILLGWQLPDVDYRLRKRGESKDAITMHSAPLISAQVVLEWMGAILDRAEPNPDLTARDRQSLRTLRAVLASITNGFARGAAAPRWLSKAAAELVVSLDDPSFHAAEKALADLARDPSANE